MALAIAPPAPRRVSHTMRSSVAINCAGVSTIGGARFLSDTQRVTQSPGRRVKQGAEHAHNYVIERNMPGAGRLSAAELAAASRVSNEALATLSDRVKWGHSYVTEDKVFCVYMADDPDAIREHARLAGPPADESSTRSAP